TKVDRTGSYMARYVAKNIVAAGLARRCEFGLAYVIGGEEPLALNLNTFGTGLVPDEKILAAVKMTFDFSPAGMIKTLNLRRPIFRQTAAYGHFGRPELNLPWEKVDKVKELKKIFK
ncbi:MAG: methionine adenosyltransferase domain-containing protein, partial [Gemmatimonadaceae bacterium]|nr:methionine adenosyltransferase domain-containing protein [Gemmatimonadaceae bacterium]